MIGQWTNHLWQSTLFAAAVVLTALAFRKNRAQVRYCLWLSASVKFLVPFALLMNLGNSLWSAFAARKIATELAPPAVSLSLPPAVSLNLEQIAQPFPDTSSFVPSAQLTHSTHWIPIAIVCVWVCGFLSVVLVRFRGWLRVRAALRASTPIDISAGVAVRSSSGVLEPGVVGFLRPVLLLPEDILKHLSPSQLETVLAHELSHIRRRDNLTAAVHMVVEAIFWFYPLVWWIGARLVEERERACDEAVLGLGGEPRDYADAILSVCKLCIESPLACVSGISGADLKKRIVRIMTENMGYKLSLGRKLVLAGVAALALAVPFMLGQAEAAQRLMTAAIKAAPKPLQTAAHAVIAEEEALSTGEIAQAALPQDLPGLGQLQFDLASGPRFEAADVRPSPPRRDLYTYPGAIYGDRFIWREAPMTKLVAFAYNTDPDNVQGGPNWIEFNRYDIVAKLPPGTPKAEQQLMVKSLLAERFGLVVHPGTAPLPAFVLTAPMGDSKLKKSAGKPEVKSDDKDTPPCNWAPQALNPVAEAFPQYRISCHNATMEQFATFIRWHAIDYLNKTTVDQTGLKGAYDFDLKWIPRNMLTRAGADGISLPDAMTQQLGLKVTPGIAPQPATLIDSVTEMPTPNVPDLDKLMPPLPPVQFEVATIRPFVLNEKAAAASAQDRVNFQGITMKQLIDIAWDLDATSPLVGAPKWLDEDRFDIVAQLPADAIRAQTSGTQGIPQEVFQQMLRGLIEDRFQMKDHWENRPASAYHLLAANPRLTPGDPNQRAKCDDGPGPDGKDPRITNPVRNRLQTCKNITMSQLAVLVRVFAGGYVKDAVYDDTGLKGTYSFTLSFSGINLVRNGSGGGPGPDGQQQPDDPNGAISLFDAMKSQLGLKLEQETINTPVLVIDHIEQQPTPN